MRTIRATAPLRWAPFFMASDGSVLRQWRNRPGTSLRLSALRDRQDAINFLMWVNAGIPVRVNPAPVNGTRDHVEFAGCVSFNEPMGEYVFQSPDRSKAYTPAEVSTGEGATNNWTAKGMGTMLHACQM